MMRCKFPSSFEPLESSLWGIAATIKQGGRLSQFDRLGPFAPP